MVTIVGNRHPYLAAGLDHPRAFAKLMPNTVDLHIDHAEGGSQVFGLLVF